MLNPTFITACRYVLSIPILVAYSSSVLAQENLETGSASIEIVTVVGQATNALITTEDLETYQANDLADVFRLNPSISVGGSVGIAQKIYVRGLEDSLVNVTVDGAPQTSTLFHHIGRVTIDPDLLQQVDVQAGAGEATSGAGAIGGAIRFKTKSADDLLEDDQSFGGKVKASSFSNDGTQVSASLYGRLSENWGALAYFNDIDRDNMVDGDGNEIFGASADQSLGFFKLSGEIAENQNLSLSYEKRDEEGQFSARPNWIVFEDDLLYDSEAVRDTAVLNYSIHQSNMLNLEATAYSTESSFRGGRFDYVSEISTVGFDLRNTSYAGNHKFTYGVDYRDDEVFSDSAIPDPQALGGSAEEGSVLGVFAQGYTQVSDPLLLSYGVRYDKYDFQQIILLESYYGEPVTDTPAESDSSEISFNAGLAYDITDNLTFGLGYAEASRGKEIGDGFTLESYLYDRSDAPVVGDDLEAEKVSNVEASLEYSTSNFNAKFALFDSVIKDAIFAESTYQNIGDVKTDGIELSFNYQWNELAMSFGYSSADANLAPNADRYIQDYALVALNGYEFIGFGNSRGDSLNIGLNYTPTSSITMGFNIAHVSSLTIENLQQDLDLGYVDQLFTLEKPSYTTVDVFAEWKVNDNLAFNLAAINLFDELYRDHSSVGDFSPNEGYEIVVGPWEAGRDVRLSLSYSF